MTSKLIAQGAEAKILLDKKNNLIIKDRIKKSYRLPELDDKIRKSRTKREEKLLQKAGNLINVPELIINKSSQDTKLNIQFIDGKKLSEYLDKFSLAKQKQILKQIGQDIAKLHDNNIIHGDLTTSNMILVEEKRASHTIKTISNDKPSHSKIKGVTDYKRKTLTESGFEQYQSASDSERIFFIDFGLGFISHKFEDKAVDIHLLKQALEAKHFKNYKILTDEFLKGYKTSKDSTKTLTQLNKVEKRGRYKH